MTHFASRRSLLRLTAAAAALGAAALTGCGKKDEAPAAPAASARIQAGAAKRRRVPCFITSKCCCLPSCFSMYARA